MNSKQRIEAAINLEAADRAPVGPLLDHFAATYTGITKTEFMQNPDSRIKAILKTMADMGPWDITFMAETVIPELLYGAPARVKWPGKDLPDHEIHQFEEFELLSPEDYDLLVDIGLTKFLQNVTVRLYPELDGLLPGLKMGLGYTWNIIKHARKVRAAGAEPAVGFMLPGPMFEYFSIGRSMGPMSMDLYDHPEKIKRAGKVWAEAMTKLSIKFSKLVGIPRVFIGLSRSSPSMISPRHFEEFVLPELDIMVNGIIDAGLYPLFHCDTNWTRNFEYFKRFPKKKIILELDGASDIFKAKEELGNNMCIMGDVPAYLLAFGKKEEVLDYCKRLLEEVGKGGGFILSSGCSVPSNAKPENVRAIFEAAEKWGRYQ